MRDRIEGAIAIFQLIMGVLIVGKVLISIIIILYNIVLAMLSLL